MRLEAMALPNTEPAAMQSLCLVLRVLLLDRKYLSCLPLTNVNNPAFPPARFVLFPPMHQHAPACFSDRGDVLAFLDLFHPCRHVAIAGCLHCDGFAFLYRKQVDNPK